MIKSNVIPFKCQLRGAKFLKENKYAMLAFEQGLGKTLTSLLVDSFNESTKFLVVCPAYLVSNWQDEITQLTNFSLTQFKIVSYERFTRDLSDYLQNKYDCMIFDESHYLKNIEAQRTKAAYLAVCKIKPEYMFLLTGTPAKNKLESLWSQFLLIHVGRKLKGFTSNVFAFREKYIIYEEKKFGSMVFKTEVGVKNVDELKDLIKQAMLIEKLDKNIDLPPARAKVISMNSTKHDKELGKIIAKHKGDLTALSHEDMASATLRRETSILKTDVTIKVLRDFLENNPKDSVVVFSWYPVAAEIIAEAFKEDSYLVTGASSIDHRTKARRGFQAGEKRVMSATIGSFSTGVTLTKAHNMIFNDYPPTGEDLAQAKSRIRRIGQDKPCLYYFIVTGPNDIKILRNIDRKESIKKTAGI